MDDEIWTQKDGTEILVNDMTEAHAKNALRMILRNRRIRLDHYSDWSYGEDVGDGWGDRD